LRTSSGDATVAPQLHKLFAKRSDLRTTLGIGLMSGVALLLPLDSRNAMDIDATSHAIRRWPGCGDEPPAHEPKLRYFLGAEIFATDGRFT